MLRWLPACWKSQISVGSPGPGLGWQSASPLFRAVAAASTLEYSPVLGLRLGQGPAEESSMVVDHKRSPGWALLTC